VASGSWGAARVGGPGSPRYGHRATPSMQPRVILVGDHLCNTRTRLGSGNGRGGGNYGPTATWRACPDVADLGRTPTVGVSNRVRGRPKVRAGSYRRSRCSPEWAYSSAMSVDIFTRSRSSRLGDERGREPPPATALTDGRPLRRTQAGRAAGARLRGVAALAEATTRAKVRHFCRRCALGCSVSRELLGQ
jgi:hypothetical protein